MIKFKYSLTLFVEEKCWIIPMIFALSVSSITDSFNNFYFSKTSLYYSVNISAFLVGWCAAAFACTKLIRWMRKNTIWSTEWERIFSK